MKFSDNSSPLELEEVPRGYIFQGACEECGTYAILLLIRIVRRGNLDHVFVLYRLGPIAQSFVS